MLVEAEDVEGELDRGDVEAGGVQAGPQPHGVRMELPLRNVPAPEQKKEAPLVRTAHGAEAVRLPVRKAAVPGSVELPPVGDAQELRRSGFVDSMVERKVVWI